MSRPVIAFFVAPLAVPVVLFPYVGSIMPTSTTNLFAIEICTVVAYVGVLIFGVPAYLFLRALRWTAFWIWPILGFIFGGVMWYVFAVLFALSLGEGVSGIRLVFTDANLLRGFLWPGGFSGLIVGTIIWLIARPDQEAR